MNRGELCGKALKYSSFAVLGVVFNTGIISLCGVALASVAQRLGGQAINNVAQTLNWALLSIAACLLVLPLLGFFGVVLFSKLDKKNRRKAALILSTSGAVCTFAFMSAVLKPWLYYSQLHMGDHWVGTFVYGLILVAFLLNIFGQFCASFFIVPKAPI